VFRSQTLDSSPATITTITPVDSKAPPTVDSKAPPPVDFKAPPPVDFNAPPPSYIYSQQFTDIGRTPPPKKTSKQLRDEQNWQDKTDLNRTMGSLECEPDEPE